MTVATGTTVHAVSIAGFPIPDEGPIFLAVLAVHVLAGSAAVVSGAGAAVTRKGSRQHVRFGRSYLLAVATVVVTMAVLALIRWPRDVHLLALGVVSGTAALVGLLDRRGRRRDPLHVLAMGMSFVALLTAFYVDNGPNLPLWNLLPAWAFWVLPALVGAPITARAALRRSPARPPMRRPRTGEHEKGPVGSTSATGSGAAGSPSDD